MSKLHAESLPSVAVVHAFAAEFECKTVPEIRQGWGDLKRGVYNDIMPDAGVRCLASACLMGLLVQQHVCLAG